MSNGQRLFGCRNGTPLEREVRVFEGLGIDPQADDHWCDGIGPLSLPEIRRLAEEAKKRPPAK